MEKVAVINFDDLESRCLIKLQYMSRMRFSTRLLLQIEKRDTASTSLEHVCLIEEQFPAHRFQTTTWAGFY